ncbi:MAG: hypothetical protein BWX64_02424 [Acidobacteria bacterium ADurb.Bin051]|nr:MAG: hypothetical protein BWX64_02424 [Acidobacteria bacterium ADurb.Bin051]
MTSHGGGLAPAGSGEQRNRPGAGPGGDQPGLAQAAELGHSLPVRLRIGGSGRDHHELHALPGQAFEGVPGEQAAAVGRRPG